MSERVATVLTDLLPSAADAPACCQLVVVEGPDRERAARIDDGTITIGTDAGCDLVLTDVRVSRRHLTVRQEGTRFAVKDLGSKNGTLYEGSALSEALVPVGATLKIGHSFVRICPRSRDLDLPPSQARRFGELVGESLAMREVFAVLAMASRSAVTVLLEGETGSGKELAARAIHDESPMRKGPFVAVDCGALPESLLDSELFGHVKGAFTGAAEARQGAFRRASGGTLFLDELGAVPAAVQARLLRVIEERRVRPVGGDEEVPVDLRIVAASRDDLEARVADGRFRSDLFYRLAVLRVRLPPLRARREDIRPIVGEILRRRGLAGDDVAGPNLDRLVAQSWPGNVRELRNVIDRALALSPSARSFHELRLQVGGGEPEPGLQVRTDMPFAAAKEAVVAAFERRYLGDVWARHDGNLSAVARAVGLDRKHLRELLKRHGLLPQEPRRPRPPGARPRP